MPLNFLRLGQLVTVSATTDDDTLTLTVTDEGRGMDAEQLESIDAFLQFNRKRHEQQGTGLGLTIASLLAKLEGCKLTIDCPQSGGTNRNFNHKKSLTASKLGWWGKCLTTHHSTIPNTPLEPHMFSTVDNLVLQFFSQIIEKITITSHPHN